MSLNFREKNQNDRQVCVPRQKERKRKKKKRN